MKKKFTYKKRNISPKGRLSLSNSAHSRLEKKNDQLYKSTGYKEIYQQKKLYHGHVLILQQKKQRVFNQDEKKEAMNDVIRTFY